MAIMMEPQHLDDLRRIVRKEVDVQTWQPVIFGSRVSGKARRFSDVDLGFIGREPLPSSVQVRLWEALDDSDIPYVVDIVDLGSTDAGFRAIAEQHMEKL